MMLIEEAAVPEAVLPVAAFKSHLRLGTGFAEDDVQDVVLKSFLRAAIAAIEARTGKAMVARLFSWSLTRLRSPRDVILPIAPVSAVSKVALVTAAGEETVLGPDRYALEGDAHAPRVISMGPEFATLPRGGKMVFEFTAGYGPDWQDLPDDLAQAVFLLAAHYYEYRNETALARGCMPFGVQSLIERYRPMRLFNGGALS